MAMTAFGVDVDAIVAAQDRLARDAWRERERVTRDWQKLGWGQEPGSPARWAGSQTASVQAVAAMLRGDHRDAAYAPPVDQGDAAEPKVVDIFLSAGPRESTLACTNDNVGSCSIWRIQVDLDAGRVLGVFPAVPDGSFTGFCQERVGFIQPAVSPDGQKLAFVGICHGNDGKQGTSVLWATDRVDYVPIEAGRGGNMPQYPNWFSDEWLLFNKTQGDHHYEKSTLWWAHSWPDFALVTPAAGLKGFSHTEEGFEDAHSSAAAADTSTGLSRIVTFGGQNTTDPFERIPRASSATGDAVRSFDLPYVDGSGFFFRECHHPAWHPRGERILCTRQEEAEKVDYGLGDQAFRRLYSADWTGTAWGAPTPLVRQLSPSEFQATSTTIWGTTLSDVFPPTTADADGCWNYHWKFAEWCGHGRYVVAVLYCVNQALVTLHSRVMLIDLWADHYGLGAVSDAYIDLVSYLEWNAGDEFGSWDGAWVTCAPAADFE